MHLTLETDTPATLAQREREREAAQIRGERLERMAGRSVRRLAGNVGDLGQADMFGGNENLFNRS